MPRLSELAREYERARFPDHRRLDLHGEGPRAARERALRWIQSRAHETPGQELLLIVERGVLPGRRPSPVAEAVEALLHEVDGKLIDWWQPFTPGSIAVRIADRPNVLPDPAPPPIEHGDGRTPETAGAARPDPRYDIPSELLDAISDVASLRIEREGHSIRLHDVVLREVWHEIQALAMQRETTIEAALHSVRALELERVIRD